jgi:hypothetical protein
MLKQMMQMKNTSQALPDVLSQAWPDEAQA